MARPLRILIPDGWYHVMSRGNRRASLFWESRLESPWERLVGGCVLGGRAYARECLQRAGANPEEQTDARRLVRGDRVSWGVTPLPSRGAY